MRRASRILEEACPRGRDHSPKWVAAPAPPLAVHGTDGAVLQGAMVLVGGAPWHGAYSVLGWTDALQLMKPEAIRR